MEETLCNKYGLAVLILVFFITACTHTPIKPDLSEKSDHPKIITTTASQTPDLIIPLLSDSSLNSGQYKTTTNDLIWEHISENLKLVQFYDHPRVAKQKEKFIEDSEYLSNVTKRSEPFIHFVLSEIKKRQMPAELAMLPIVESGYYPRARSRAKAEGLWQIMSMTGKELGLKRTYSYDGRHDVYASTSAALEYLEQMYNRFDQDWLLALAAYNAGPQRVTRALKYSNNTYDENIYWGLHLPRETREYIPKILALCAIVNDNKLHTTLLYPVADTSYIETIQLPKRISPAKLIRAADVSKSEIKLLNPALRNLTIPIHEGYHLLAPKEDAKLLSHALQSLPEESQPELALHKVNRGDTLSTIAYRYGTSINALREANNLTGNMIVAGRSLLVPKEPGAKIKPPPKKQTHERSPASINKTIIAEPYFYVVATGDSFWKIANRNNTTVQRLYEINGRNADEPLLPGETILID